jgi:hypothetical protein
LRSSCLAYPSTLKMEETPSEKVGLLSKDYTAL